MTGQARSQNLTTPMPFGDCGSAEREMIAAQPAAVLLTRRGLWFSIAAKP